MMHVASTRNIQVWCSGCDSQINTEIPRGITTLEELRLELVRIHRQVLAHVPTICTKPDFMVRIGA